MVACSSTELALEGAERRRITVKHITANTYVIHLLVASDLWLVVQTPARCSFIAGLGAIALHIDNENISYSIRLKCWRSSSHDTRACGAQVISWNFHSFSHLYFCISSDIMYIKASYVDRGKPCVLTPINPLHPRESRRP